ncbi:MAG: prefoldin subunit alpha [Candidatus Bathyarchaeota archaeon]|nr:MAG: prefoldin subunit alpha [Candidatus Bathyarchaeota archaeon]
MSSEQENFRRLAVELRILEGTAEAIQSRMNFVNAALAELGVAKMTLDGLQKVKKNASLLVPVGGGSYVKARLEGTDKMIVGIGANVAVEKTMKAAKEKTGARMTDLEKTRTSLQQQMAQVVEKIQNNRSLLQELTAKLSEGERRKSVRKTKNTG